MSERFTEQTRRVMSAADREAQRLGHDHLGSEHILLGILRDEASLAAQTLTQLGVEFRVIRLHVEQLVQGGHEGHQAMKRPLTPLAARVLQHARDEAARLGPDFRVGPEHILIGLMQEPEGVAAQVLGLVGLRTERIRAALVGESIPSGIQPAVPREVEALAEVEENIQPAEQVDHLHPSKQPAYVPRPAAEIDLDTPTFDRPIARRAGCLWHLWYLFLWLVFGYRDPLAKEDNDPLAPPGVRLTDRASQVLKLADREARQLHHEYIGPEHLLLGIVRLGTGAAATVLHQLGVNIYTIRQEVLKIVQPGPTKPALRRLPITTTADNAFRHAAEEARRMNHDSVGTEHLLLGLLSERDGVAIQVLHNLGLTAERVRDTLQSL